MTSSLPDTVHLPPGAVLGFQVDESGNCAPYGVLHVHNGDTLQTWGPWPSITDPGDHLLIETDLDAFDTSHVLMFHVTQTLLGPIPQTFEPEVLLGGPVYWLGASVYAMHDSLRRAGWLPNEEPYTALGYQVTENAGVTVAPGRFADQSSAFWNVVDWVLVELRDPADPSVIVASKAALLCTVGRITDPDGYSFSMNVEHGAYLLAIRHRNHLSIRTWVTVPFTGVGVRCDLKHVGAPVVGVDPRMPVSIYFSAMWPGNASTSNLPQRVSYAGAGNDRDRGRAIHERQAAQGIHGMRQRPSAHHHPVAVIA